jgi:hypothetical protein
MPRTEPGGDMPADASSNVPHCQACQAQLKIGDAKCWLCGAPVVFDVNAPVVTNRPAGPPMTTGHRLASFSMATLMMFVTLVAVVCGVFSIAPGVGAALALVLMPVLTHMVIATRREEAMGYTLRPGERFILFFGSLGLVVVAGVAASITFGISCFAGFFAGAAAGDAFGAKGYDSIAWGAFIGMGLGAIAAAYVGYKAMITMSRSSALRHEGAPPLSRGNKVILAAAMLLAVIGAAVFCVWCVN